MTKPLTSPLRTFCVLDIETALDPMAVAELKSRPPDMPKALLRITALSQLWAISSAGGWSVERIKTKIATSPHNIEGEEKIVETADDALRRLRAADGTLVTFNGVHHDLPILRRRAAHALRFDLADLMTGTPKHLDLMLGMTRPERSNWSSLAYALAGLGLPHEAEIDPASTLEAPGQKCEADVAGTFLLLLTELSMKAASGQPLLLGFAALGDYIERHGAGARHLAPFARHELVRAGRRFREGLKPVRGSHS